MPQMATLPDRQDFGSIDCWERVWRGESLYLHVRRTGTATLSRALLVTAASARAIEPVGRAATRVATAMTVAANVNDHNMPPG